MSAFQLTPGQQAAKALVAQIAKDHGCIPEDIYAKMEPDMRRTVEEAMLQKDRIIGSSALTLAKNLYTSSARFVFELLQNADDNNYTRALSNGEDPYVSFSVHDDKIIIECNEDGFTHENLKAICNIGKSSKAAVQGYIGEKGIGFKSVFMAAWKVHIQSNDLSFTFKHRKGDSGLGMISPNWQDPDGDSEEGVTRITLFLHEHSDLVAETKQRETIEKQFRELQDTLLLFLRKLRRIHISFYDEDGYVLSSTSYSLGGASPVIINKTITTGKDTNTIKKRYHVTKRVARYLPRNENRTYQEGEPQGDATSEIVLAFPLTPESVPIVEDQEIFAFLPMRPMGFKFLIQADFVTEASRQGIVTTSERNEALRDAIAETFVQAVTEFCDHPTLQYQWMRWLPQRGSFPWDSFWLELLEKIQENIEVSRTLRTRGKRQLARFNSLRRLRQHWCDRNWDPLFNDLESSEVYLAKEYREEDLELLERYGLKALFIEELVDRIEHDLKKPIDQSRMKSTETSQDWHSRAAKGILGLNKALSGRFSDRIRSLQLAPLIDGTWVSTQKSLNCQLYYSQCNKRLPIPQDLSLRLIDPKASKNSERRELFDALGVSVANVHFVRALILGQKPAGIVTEESLAQPVGHLTYLYLSHHFDPEDAVLGHYVYNQNNEVCFPYMETIYIPSTAPFGPSELLKATQEDPEGFSASFIHEKYLEYPPDNPKGQSLSWVEWLEKKMRIHSRISLLRTSDSSLSSELLYVAKHRPHLLAGTLRHHWKHEGERIRKSPSANKRLRELAFPTRENCSYLSRYTYLPLPNIEEQVERYLNTNEFPFLELGEPLSSDTWRRDWGFLVDVLGVQHTDNVDFYVELLCRLREADSVESDKFLEIYRKIDSRSNASNCRAEAQDMIREEFKDKSLLFLPQDFSFWACSAECLWDAPKTMRSKLPLKYLYCELFPEGKEDMSFLEHFCTSTLSLRDAGWDDYLVELRYLKRWIEEPWDETENPDWVREIYGILDRERGILLDECSDDLKRAFRDEKLIYVSRKGDGTWHTVEECLWSSATQVKGKVSLNEFYPDLEEFFVNYLGVQELTFELAHEELKQKGIQVPPPSLLEVKDTIWALNSLLEGEMTLPDPKSLLESRVFPVRYPNGRVHLCTAKENFTILDRKSLGEIFSDKVKTIDFTLEEVRKLGKFLVWLGLESRYISSAVKEVSSVTNDGKALLDESDRNIKNKASGLFRIARHFNSPRVEGNSTDLYGILRQSQVYATKGISSELHISQDGNDFTHVKEKSELHIHEQGNNLQIYVPRNEARQAQCYLSKLPQRLLEWMMADPTTQHTNPIDPKAITVMTAILNAPRAVVSSILEDHGITEADVPPDCPETGDIDDDDDETTVLSPADPVSTAQRKMSLLDPDSGVAMSSGSSARLQSRNLPFSTGSPLPLRRFGNERSSNAARMGVFDDITRSETSHNAAITSNSDVALGQGNTCIRADDLSQLTSIPARLVPDDDGYLELLTNVVSSARVKSFPASSDSISGGPGSSVAFSTLRRFPFYPSSDRDKKIGALGELFAFELLSGLANGLPEFSRANWKSTIRKFVTIHPDYADMNPWEGQETADIVYDDEERVFTNLLVSKGYLDAEGLVGKKPRFLIEVKTTTSNYETPFYMSRYQYQRMQKYSIAAQQSSDSPTVYVILRVFNVDKTNVDMRVLMDPEALRQEGRLNFIEDTWAVTPARVSM